MNLDWHASDGWNVENSWNGGNSGYEMHKVCSRQKNGLGLCDMEGNVWLVSLE